jgi:transposase
MAQKVDRESEKQDDSTQSGILDAAKSWPDFAEWMFSWVERIGVLYACNARRLETWDEARALEDQTVDFMQRHQALEQAIDQMAAHCDQALQQPDLHSIQCDVLRSLKRHWSGLNVFVQFPNVPMDNNTAERRMRNPAMGRKNYYGSGRQWSAALAATMFSLFQTLLLWKLNPHHWLYSYLTACAEKGGQAPPDLTPFLPWEMGEARRQQVCKPMP